jgi:hypothetical protein
LHAYPRIPALQCHAAVRRNTLCVLSTSLLLFVALVGGGYHLLLTSSAESEAEAGVGEGFAHPFLSTLQLCKIPNIQMMN